MINAGLTPEEITVATMLLDGETERGIYRKMNISAAEVGQHIQSIRQKLNLTDNADPCVAAIVAEYKLTKREAEIFEYLRGGITTEQIAAELYVSNETIRYHVSNLLKKLGIEKRGDLAGWLKERD